jgi:hypothetical protein
MHSVVSQEVVRNVRSRSGCGVSPALTQGREADMVPEAEGSLYWARWPWPQQFLIHRSSPGRHGWVKSMGPVNRAWH